MKNKKIIVPVLMSLFTLSLVPSLTNAYYTQGEMMNGYGYGYEHQFFGGIMMIFVVSLVIFGILTLLKYVKQDQTDDRNIKHNSALDILCERYAKGEIQKEEFESKKKDLVN